MYLFNGGGRRAHREEMGFGVAAGRIGRRWVSEWPPGWTFRYWVRSKHTLEGAGLPLPARGSESFSRCCCLPPTGWYRLTAWWKRYGVVGLRSPGERRLRFALQGSARP